VSVVPPITAPAGPATSKTVSAATTSVAALRINRMFPSFIGVLPERTLPVCDRYDAGEAVEQDPGLDLHG
jgi:hypothetical protein